jgi:RHS repeat-associated protein
METGLHYLGVRYYGATLGRFTSPDPLGARARPQNPQSWNRYSYVLIDPWLSSIPMGCMIAPLELRACRPLKLMRNPNETNPSLALIQESVTLINSSGSSNRYFEYRS